jgi:hypothetical protein
MGGGMNGGSGSGASNQKIYTSAKSGTNFVLPEEMNIAQSI